MGAILIVIQVSLSLYAKLQMVWSCKVPGRQENAGSFPGLGNQLKLTKLWITASERSAP